MLDSYHFIGIGGIGMSALAHILLEKGAVVSGSDVKCSEIVEQLQRKGAKVSLGHIADHVNNPSAVILSTDIQEVNPELQAARMQHVPCLHRSELLNQLMQGYKPLLVSGTHGKTTTSSLLAHTLMAVGLHPCYAIGGKVNSLPAHGGYGKGDYFVAEADESDGSFLNYIPFGAIITNIDNDHLNYWKDMESLIEGFRRFAHSVISEKHLFWCGDDDHLKSLGLKGFSYGFDDKNALYIKNFSQQGWQSVFDFSFESHEYLDVKIPLVGAHNVLNAAAVMGLALKLNITQEKIRQAFMSFCGIGRRAEMKGQIHGITVLDDYAHHPSEVFATLRALKHACEQRRLVVAFQPHRYTRTRDCFHEFSQAFEDADLLIVAPIYAASESPIAGVDSMALVRQIQQTSALDVHYCPREKIVAELVSQLRPGDVLVTMGAGDITRVGPEVLERLSIEMTQ